MLSHREVELLWKDGGSHCSATDRRPQARRLRRPALRLRGLTSTISGERGGLTCRRRSIVSLLFEKYRLLLALADGNSSKPLQSKQKAIDRRVAIRERPVGFK
jgi:hypothetical protein